MDTVNIYFGEISILKKLNIFLGPIWSENETGCKQETAFLTLGRSGHFHRKVNAINITKGFSFSSLSLHHGLSWGSEQEKDQVSPFPLKGSLMLSPTCLTSGQVWFILKVCLSHIDTWRKFHELVDHSISCVRILVYHRDMHFLLHIHVKQGGYFALLIGCHTSAVGLVNKNNSNNNNNKWTKSTVELTMWGQLMSK